MPDQSQLSHELQGIDALQEVGYTADEVYSFVSPRIKSAAEADAHAETYTDFQAATVLYLGQGAVVGVTEVYIQNEDEDPNLPAIAREQYTDTVGGAQNRLRTLLPVEATSEAYREFRSFLRYAVAGPVEGTGRQLLAAHVVQASASGELADVLVYPGSVGEQLDQHFPLAVDKLHTALSPAQRDVAELTYSHEMPVETRVPLLAATIMPTPWEMAELVNAYHQA